MPVNDRYPLDDVLAACEAYYERKRRKVFVEYVMLAGVNDSHAQATQLAEVLDPRVFKVNLIPYNPTGSPFEGSSPKAIEAFRAELERRGLGATVRLTRGRDIDAACGQLAARRGMIPTRRPYPRRSRAGSPSGASASACTARRSPAGHRAVARRERPSRDRGGGRASRARPRPRSRDTGLPQRGPEPLGGRLADRRPGRSDRHPHRRAALPRSGHAGRRPGRGAAALGALALAGLARAAH